MARWIFACLALGFTTLACAQIVECIDAQGNRAYMPTCPDGTVKRRDIEEPPVPLPPKSGGANDASSQLMKAQEKAFAQRREERLKAAAAATAKEKAAMAAKQTCAADQRRLDLLEAGRRFKRTDPDTGEHVPMDENQRQDEISTLTAQMQSLGDACR